MTNWAEEMSEAEWAELKEAVRIADEEYERGETEEYGGRYGAIIVNRGAGTGPRGVGGGAEEGELELARYRLGPGIQERIDGIWQELARRYSEAVANETVFRLEKLFDMQAQQPVLGVVPHSPSAH